MSPALLAFFLSHGISFYSNFLGRREYENRTLQQQMAAPYRRIVLMHVSIIFGGFLAMTLESAVPALVLLVVLKIIVDLRAHLNEHGGQEKSPQQNGSEHA